MSASKRIETNGSWFAVHRYSALVAVLALGMVATLPTSAFAQTTACCSVYGCYDDLTPADCTAAGDTPIDGVSCDDETGQSLCEPKGACCAKATCQDATTEADCVKSGGSYVADGASCSDGTCDLSGVEPNCECDDPAVIGGICEAPAVPETITLRKKIDLAIYNGADANGPSRLKLLLKNPQVNRRAKVANVKAAVKAICAIWRRSGKVPINILLSGHGSPGNQQVGTEFIGNRNQDREDAKTDFITSLNGKIKDITLLGCSTAKGAKGQAFLQELRDGLTASSAKGYTDLVYLDVAANQYTTAGDKKKNIIPAASTWSLVAMTALMIGAAVFVSARIRRPRLS